MDAGAIIGTAKLAINKSTSIFLNNFQTPKKNI